jgi:large subunit ribosomal protein L15
MHVNTLKPARGSKRPRLRVGRGASAGQGKTCGRGVKGQRARKGGYHKVGFEGGQMPLQRRLPKVGFRSAMKRTRAEVRLSELAKVDGGVVDLEALKKAGVIPMFAERAKVVLSGEIGKVVTLKGVGATKGARAAIEAAGGKVEEPPREAEEPPKKARKEIPTEAPEAASKAAAKAALKAAAKEAAKEARKLARKEPRKEPPAEGPGS